MNSRNQESEMIENPLIEIDVNNCTKCKACIKACPANLFYLESNNLEIQDNFEEYCIKCGHCVAICPVEIIRLKLYKDKELKRSDQFSNIPSFDSLRNLMLTRRSIRQYKDKAVPEEIIEKIIDVARYSPTASNTENVFYTIVQDKGKIKEISGSITSRISKFVELYGDQKGREILKKTMNEKAYQLAVENLPRSIRILEGINNGIDFWCWDAPILIFIHGKKDIGGISGNSALAAAHIMLLAKSLGLSTCSLGYLKYFSNESKKIKKIIEIPKNHEIGYCLSLGYSKVKYKKIPSREVAKINWI
jgi:nitroreductase/NAD-dependent dihydropyrimidine dehydrogenase PreA subunit